MNFLVVRATKPDHGERLVIVRVVRFRRSATFKTRQSFDFAFRNGVVKGRLRRVPLWKFLAIAPYVCNVLFQCLRARWT
jgi:hypothetical protein